MEGILGEENIQIPLLLVSNDGRVTIQIVPNGDQSRKRIIPDRKNLGKTISTYGNYIERNNDSLSGKETLVNIDVKSEVLEDYMEVYVTYRCKECAYVSHDQKEFHQHCLKHLLKENHKEIASDNTTYVYLCSTCSKAFNSAEETKQHMVKEHDLKNYKFGCDEVPNLIRTIDISIETEKGTKVVKQFSKRKKRKLDEIMQSIDPTVSINNLNYFCRKRNCKCKFRNENDLEIHERCHLDSEIGNCSKRLFQCFKCYSLFNGWHSCCYHLYKVHAIDCDLLKCPVCETYRTSHPLRLENHIRIHSDVRAFTCKHCGKTFKQSSQLRNHNVIHSQQKPNWSKSKQCNICFKMYSSSKSLKKHKEEVHCKLRPFVCSICGHASARKAMLLMHQRQHTGQKPYNCQLCNFKTADHNSLRKHMMRHTGVRPYKCPHCDYTAIQSGSYKNHLRIVHPNMEGMFNCTICHYNTISEDNYIRHISDHLTGLIKDNGVYEDGNSKDSVENQNSPDFLSGTLFTDNRIQLSDKNEENSTDYPSHNGNQAVDDDVVDTGGITIPAEPTHSALEETKT